MAKKGKSPFFLKKLVLLFDAGQKYIEKARMNGKMNKCINIHPCV
ncbi:hypothetical protein HMPREF0373_00701 [Eubacterium ramulus ATCC 29099]|jgi:hypothetical protein|uniref:Uncharacterized protein n=1 Tax=Eubacterium ramulus ATCC 29099 TaxID=1256908 RepID=U2Q357_EUBRA|nr:hypothetical protein HMPREF0373_00701 [Eubacterium ramulus ATCC 29099]